MRLAILALILPLLAPPAAFAQTPGPAPAAAEAAAGKRFPQPVRVGDLVGRQLLEPIEAQPVLGRVEGVTRGADGALALVVRIGGVLGIGGRSVAVPVAAVALLGEHVALLDLKPDELRALPTASSDAARLGLDERIRVGLVRPFH